MKKIYSISMNSVFLLVLALFCASCTKEKLPEFQERNNNVQSMKEVITDKNGSTTVSSTAYLSTSSSWWKTGPAVKPTQSRPLVVYARIILPEEKNEWIAMELYSGTSQTGLRLIAWTKSSSEKTSSDYRYTALCWTAMAGTEYYVKISCAYGSCWLPKVELDRPYGLTIPGTSITVVTGITFP